MQEIVYERQRGDPGLPTEAGRAKPVMFVFCVGVEVLYMAEVPAWMVQGLGMFDADGEKSSIQSKNGLGLRCRFCYITVICSLLII